MVMVMRSRHDDGDEDEIIADGDSVRVRVDVMDQRRFFDFSNVEFLDHQPHYGRASDAVLDARKQARDAYVRRTCEAWRTAGRVQSNKDADPTEPDPNAANAVQRELETWQGRDPVDVARAVEARP